MNRSKQIATRFLLCVALLLGSTVKAMEGSLSRVDEDVLLWAQPFIERINGDYGYHNIIIEAIELVPKEDCEDVCQKALLLTNGVDVSSWGDIIQAVASIPKEERMKIVECGVYEVIRRWMGDY